MEEMVAEIVAEMDYLRSREQKLRDTNESTNNRVKWFAFGTMGMLVALGAWQVIYLRAYFRYDDPCVRMTKGSLLTIILQIKASYLGVCRQQVGIFYGKVRCVISGCRIRRYIAQLGRLGGPRLAVIWYGNINDSTKLFEIPDGLLDERWRPNKSTRSTQYCFQSI